MMMPGMWLVDWADIDLIEAESQEVWPRQDGVMERAHWPSASLPGSPPTDPPQAPNVDRTLAHFEKLQAMARPRSARLGSSFSTGAGRGESRRGLVRRETRRWAMLPPGRFRAASSRALPKQLWRSLANVMSLGGTLPAEYGQPRTLAVEVGREHAALVGQPGTVGTYGDRLIRVFPCPDRSVGYLTHTFLHELAHAWIDVYHPDFPLGGPEEEFAELFAGIAFAALPERPEGFCSGHPAELPVDARRSAGFQKFFQLFVRNAHQR